MNKKLFILIIGIIMFSIISFSTYAVNIRFFMDGRNSTMMMDTSALEATPTKNFGFASETSTRSSTATSFKRSYYMWNVTNISNTCDEILDVSFNLYIHTMQGAFTDSIHEVNATFLEGLAQGEVEANPGELTWLDQPCGVNFDNAVNCNLTAEDSQEVNANNRYWTWNVTGMFRKAVNDVKNNLTMILISDENNEGGGASHGWDSK
ncbi:MAG: DNRLRE domain-containing protein, partial [Nanoarchaeota archaeon]|nr:DNRLRE domain-containing protein [Nanoarchaeota archaeon]